VGLRVPVQCWAVTATMSEWVKYPLNGPGPCRRSGPRAGGAFGPGSGPPPGGQSPGSTGTESRCLSQFDSVRVNELERPVGKLEAQCHGQLPVAHPGRPSHCASAAAALNLLRLASSQCIAICMKCNT
jgi:hypothetical protein